MDRTWLKYAMALPLAWVPVALCACGGSSETSAGPLPAQATPAGKAEEPDSYAVALSVAPWSEWSIQPEGGANDKTHTARVSAGADGELRFYPPSEDWGSRLQLDSSSVGVSTRHIVVDLDDASTYTRKSLAELEPRHVGVQPALTGDLTAVTVRELLNRGYPPRPDPVATPEQYSEWVEHVTKPLDLIQGVPVARLGAQGGTYDGAVGGVPWDGFIQSGGFLSNGVADSSLFYMTYTAIFTVPTAYNCTHTYCGTLIWAGIGGWPSSFFGQYPSGGLFQSGIHIQTTTSATPTVKLFYEYAPTDLADVPLPAGDVFNVGDQIRAWGWSSADSTCQNAAASGAFACFSFISYSRNWAYVPMAVPTPANAWYLPTTANWAVEKPQYSAAYTAKYATTTISSALAYDTNGNAHGGPATGGDPYEWVSTGSGSDPSQGLSKAQFANGSQSTPAEPMQFVWNKY